MDPAMLMVGIVVIVFMILIALGIFYIIQTRHIERMTEIEHGMEEDRHDKKRYLLNTAFVFCSLGGGVLAGYFIIILSDMPAFIAMSGSLLLFGGLGLFAAYYTDQSDRG